MSKQFQFKEFNIDQDRCAMKIGTDGVLLGAWTSIQDAYSILDIGAGTGILALMLAQRSDAEQIDALEIDEDAYEQCVDNFENSSWADRLFCYHAALDEFVEEMEDEKYDLIISNPPFYTEDYKSGDTARNMARFADSLPFEELIKFASKLLSDEGSFAVIIPYSEEKYFLQLSEKVNLFPNRITRVRGTENTPLKRSLLQLSFTEKPFSSNELILEVSRHQYTQDYQKMVAPFYLKL
jgi:tRNA1Val (adenine37-N6)-methyltransferase